MLIADESKIRFMDQCRRLKGLPRLLVREALCGKAAQLVVYQGHEFIGGGGVALLDLGQNPRYLTHAAYATTASTTAACQNDLRLSQRGNNCYFDRQNEQEEAERDAYVMARNAERKAKQLQS